MRKQTSNQEKPVVFEAFKVEWGWCAAASTKAGLCAFVLPLADEDAAIKEVLCAQPEARRSHAPFTKLITQVNRYFGGWTPKFGDLAVDITSGTEFQQRVWRLIRRIPYGEVRSYHWIGMEMGRPTATRAIGGAVGANPIPLVIPCHRVVGAEGNLCGFSATGGMSMKARLLERERVPVFNEAGTVRVHVQAAR